MPAHGLHPEDRQVDRRGHAPPDAAEDGGAYVAVNVGSDNRNHQIKDLAAAVTEAVPATAVGTTIVADAVAVQP